MSMDVAKSLIAAGKLKEAGAVLDEMLSGQPENDGLWYLRGIVSLKLRNYNGAQEAFNRAVLLRRRGEYLRMIGVAHMELFELEDAVEAFGAAVEKDESDVLSLFFLSVCHMFFDSPLSVEYIRRAYEVDRKRTRQLLNNFYSSFFGGRGSLDQKTRERLLESLGNL